MTSPEDREIDQWMEAARKHQPPGTMAVFFAVRNGRVHCFTPLERREFPDDDLSAAEKLVVAQLDRLIEQGSSHG